MSADVVCPACGAGVECQDGTLTCPNGHVYPSYDGIPGLVYPSDLLPSDAEFREKYDEGAARYNEGMAWLFKSFFTTEDAVRSDMADELQLRRGARVLEVSAGTGGDSQAILASIGPAGQLVATDLSPMMLQLARDRLRHHENVDYVVCNGSYLPFKDGSFDAVFHFGGVNEFAEKDRAIREMARVTKSGGRVVFGDESVPPWLRQTKFGRALIAANKLYSHTVPLDALPVTARDVRLRWVLGDAFYLVSFNVGEEPRADYDLPIPGKRDSLRQRFQRVYPGEDL